MPAISISTAYGCLGGAGYVRLDSAAGTVSNATWTLHIEGSAGGDYSQPFEPTTDLPLTVSGIADGSYDVWVTATAGGGTSSSDHEYPVLSCAVGPGGLVLDSATATAETAARNDGTATIQASGGTAPLTASLSGPTSRPDQPATAGQPITFTGLAPGSHTVAVTDNATPEATVSAVVTVAVYVGPVEGCTDEYAGNYDPDATSDTTPSSCTYAPPRWRSAWGPTGMHVRVAATPGQQQAFIAAELFIGFRAGHPLAAVRPLGQPVTLRATVGPDGFATFRCGPFLRSSIGAPDGSGGYRLDLNSLTAYTSDLYVGYELRRSTGQMLEHGYALNAAVPDEQLPRPYGSLSPFFPGIPTWPGFTDYPVSYLGYDTAYGTLSDTDRAIDFEGPVLPCPLNPLPVAWLAPGGGYGYWVFSGRHSLSDDIGEGQAYNEASTGERRWSERGAARRTITASSGVFSGPELAEGLATLFRSPQAWCQPVVGGPWVALTLDSGSFPVRRVGVRRNEITITMTLALAEYAQGQ